MGRGITATCVILVLISCAWARKRRSAPVPTSFTIGRHTFFDFGPPHDYYELFIVSGMATGTSVKRITLTPTIDACTLPARVETASASLNQPISELLGGMNPCSIPEKELHRELKRCKKCLVFSGVGVVMRVQCGDQTRLIQSKILDKDIFDPRRANTPKDTSWTMRLLSRLDDAVGPGVMSKPMFAIPSSTPGAKPALDSTVIKDISQGDYDRLFPNAPDKASALYINSQKTAPHSIVRLVSVEPFSPVVSKLPPYPGIAKLAHVEGDVSFDFYVGVDGHPTGLTFDAGPALLHGAVTAAVNNWSFDEKGSLQKVRATIKFDLNCPTRPEMN